MPRTRDSLVQDGHTYVAELDRAIIDLIRRRTDACLELAALRRAVGGPTIELARENEVLRRYREALGRTGTSLAMLLTELGRREHSAPEPPPAPERDPGQLFQVAAHPAGVTADAESESSPSTARLTSAGTAAH